MSENLRRPARAHGGADPALGHRRTQRRRAGRALGALLALFLVAPALQAQPVCAPGTIYLRRADDLDGGSAVRFSAEVADDAGERATGLMNRPALPSSAAMLFVYPGPRRASFWMKNTLIPLDILFADQTGTVLAVHPMAVPLDETPINGGEGVMFVVEINGGLARTLGLGAGAVILHPAIDPALAKWPCLQG